MSIKYTRLFQINVVHSRFLNGNCPGLQIQPSSISHQIMNTYGLRMRPSSSGLEIYQGVKEQEANSKIDVPIVLSFFLNNSDPTFKNYTDVDLPDDGATKIFFAHTLPAEADTVHPISPKSQVAFTSLQHIIQFSPPPDDTSLTIKFYTITGEKIYEEVLSPEDAAKGIFPLFNLNGRADDGQLLLNLETEDGQTQEQRLFILSSQAIPRALGVLQIVVFPSVAQALIAGQGPVYQLSFSPRETFWRYYFFPGNSSFEQLKLFKNGEALTAVSGPVKVRLPTGNEAQVMTLQSPMALLEQQADRLELEVVNSQGPLKIQLPTPNAERLIPGQDENGQQAFYSDMYIYL